MSEYAGWENFEMLEYSMQGIRDMIAGGWVVCDPDHEAIILHTLTQLPKKVIDFTVKQINFADVGNAEGQAYYTNTDTYVIILTASLWERTIDEQMYVISHEIAHAFLGHRNWDDQDGYDPDRDPLAKEKEADALVESWRHEAAK